MTQFEIPYKRSVISYLRIGNGPRIVFCFHGYGESADQFRFLEAHAGNLFTFIAIDLPYHGRTVWADEQPCTANDISDWIKAIFTQLDSSRNLPLTGVTLMGYSLGGRVALSLYEQDPVKYHKLVLLAPDGLVVNKWYWLATQTSFGRRLFAYTMNHPGWFYSILKVCNRVGFVNTSIFKFVNYYIGDAEVRRLLYARWTVLRKLRPRLHDIRMMIRKQHTMVRLVYGKHDRIILPVRGEKFIKGIEENCKLVIIPAGHQVLHEKHVADILEALLH